MQNKIDKVNERLNEYFKDNCSACTHNHYNIEDVDDCELEICNFEMNEYAKGLIDDINEILYKQLPERCMNPMTTKDCEDCRYNVEYDEDKDYDCFLPCPTINWGCLNYEKASNE